MSEVVFSENGENVENNEYDRLASDREDSVRLTLDDYRRILRELDQNRDLQNRRREKLSQVSQRRNLRKKRASDANQETSTRSSTCYLCSIRVALEDITTFAICRGCDRTVCRGRRCSDWDRGTGYWECITCIRSRDSQIRAGEWILDQLNQRFKSPRSDTSRDDLSFKDAETQSEGSFLGSAHSISLEQKEKVREFLEDVIASMIGGSLDNVPVNQTHKHPSYLPLQDEECPGVAHVNLKRLIQKVIEEALNLPDLFNFSGYPPRPESHLPYFSTKKYEQLLATAVLNKVIDHYRNPKNHQENSSGIQSGSELDSNHNPVTEKTGLLSPGQKALDKRLEEASQGSESSLKTRSTESDETYLSDYIQKHRVPLPDLSAASSESTVDDVSEVASTAGTEGTWEENWLFKKRKVKTETNSTAIGMLVPSPTEEVKALIGDKNVDEVSDLSEAGSDAEEDTQDRPATKLIESKTIIGGKNDLISLEDTSSATESLLSNPDSGINVTEAKNEALLDQDFPEPIQTFNGALEAPIPTPRQSTVTENHVTRSSEDLYRENFLSHIKPEKLPESDLPNSPGFPGEWVLIHGCWEVSDPNQSILINSGQYTNPPSELDLTDECPVNHQVLPPERLFAYRFLNELKPDSLPSREQESEIGIGVSALRIFSYGYLADLKPEAPPVQETEQDTLPTPEVELSNTDEFVCVMKYDEKRQLIVCGSPKASRKASPEEDWEPQVCEKTDEEVKETPPAAEDDTVFQEKSDTECHKSPVPLPRKRSIRKSQGEEKQLEMRSIIPEDLKEGKCVEEYQKVEKCQSKLTQIHVRVEDVQEQVKIVEEVQVVEKIQEERVEIQVKKVEIQEKESERTPEIHLRTVEEPEKKPEVLPPKEKEPEKTPEIHLRAVQESEKESEILSPKEEEPERTPEIHLRTVDSEPVHKTPEEAPEIHLRSVEEPEKKPEVFAPKEKEPEKSPEIHLRTVNPEPENKTPEVNLRTIEEPEKESEVTSPKEKEPEETIEIHLRTEELPEKVESGKSPEIHLRTVDEPKERELEKHPETEAATEDIQNETKYENAPEIHLRTVEAPEKSEPEELPVEETKEDAKATPEVHEKDPEIHLRTVELLQREPDKVKVVDTEKVSQATPEIHLRTVEEKSEELLKKDTPEIHLRTVDNSEVKEPSEVPEIHLRTTEAPNEKPGTSIVKETKEKLLQASKQEPTKAPEIHLRTVEEVKEQKSKDVLKTEEPEIHLRTIEDPKEKEPKKSPVVAVKEETLVIVPKEEPKKEPVTQSKAVLQEPKQAPEVHPKEKEPEKSPVQAVKEETLVNIPKEAQKQSNQIVKEPKEPESNVKTVKTVETKVEKIETLVTVIQTEPKKEPEIHLRTVEAPKGEEPKEPVTKLETVPDKVETVKEPEIHLRTIEALRKPSQGETEEELNAKIDEILKEPTETKEVDIMSTSQEIKEQLSKIVKSDDEETPRERPKTLSLENEMDPSEEQVHLRYKSPIFQNLLPRSPPSVVKLSAIPNDEVQQLISVANIIKRSSWHTPEEPEKGFGDGSTNLTNREDPPNVSTNTESIETVSKPERETLSQSPEPDSLEDEHLIPGSIAEREHLKWQHPDADIPNNPYSPEALQKRLVVKTYQSQSSTTSTTSHIEDSPKTPERSLQVVLGESSPDYKRYGRDYYINDAKRSSGSRKKLADSSMSEEDKSGVFAATPIRVDEAEASGLSIDSSETSNTSLQLTDSLTPSEDSDTTRIYEIETRETRMMRQSVILSAKKPIGSTRTPPSTPTEEDAPPPAFPISVQAIQEETKALKEIEEEKTQAIVKKSISSDTVKFFAPKKPPVFSPTTPTSSEKFVPNGTSTEKKKEINNNEELNKVVIEEEVLSTLPSVKKLMSAFSTTNQPEEAKLIIRSRPKSLPLQSDPEAPKVTEPAKKTSPNGKSPMIPGYSITARSLSKQFRDELKHSTSQEDEAPKEEERGKRHASPERPPSPVLMPGRLKSNIAFFENLRKQ